MSPLTRLFVQFPRASTLNTIHLDYWGGCWYYVLLHSLPSRPAYRLLFMGFIILMACILIRRYHNEMLDESHKTKKDLAPISKLGGDISKPSRYTL